MPIELNSDGNYPDGVVGSVTLTVNAVEQEIGFAGLVVETGGGAGAMVGTLNPLPVLPPVATPALSALDDNGSTQQAAAANAARANLLILNDSDVVAFGKLGGATAGLDDFNFSIAPGQLWSMARDLGFIYRGAVHLIWETNSAGKARITDASLA